MYMYEITNGVPDSVVAPQPRQQILDIIRLLPPESPDRNIQMLRANLNEEIRQDYYFSIKRSIGIYQQGLTKTHIYTPCLFCRCQFTKVLDSSFWDSVLHWCIQ